MASHTRLIWRQGLLTCCVMMLGACVVPAQLPDDGYVNVPGGRVAFRVIGDVQDGIPMLVIHGGPGGNTCASAVTMAEIAKQRPVIVYDQLGSGFSERITDLETLAVVPRFVEEVAAIRNELGLDEVHLFGGSWGAAVAVEYLLTKQPAGVRSVTLVGPYVSTKQWLSDTQVLVAQLSQASQDAIRAAIDSSDFETPEFEAANAEYWSQFILRNPVADAVRTACTKTPTGDSGLYEYMWGPAEFFSNGTLKDFDRIDRLHELNLPVLFIIGEYDEARPDTVREYQRRIAGSELVILPDAGHASNSDQPVLFDNAVKRFLADVESR